MFAGANCFLIICSIHHWKDHLKSQSSEMSNKLAVHGKMRSWPHNIKSSQTTEENEGTMLSYSGKAYALKEQDWLKTNTIMKKSLLRGKKAKSTEELRKQRNQHGGNRGSLVLYGCFRSLFSKSSTSTSGPTGQIWGSSPFHPAFPFVLKDTAWMPFCVSAQGGIPWCLCSQPVLPRRGRSSSSAFAWEPVFHSHCCIHRARTGEGIGAPEKCQTSVLPRGIQQFGEKDLLQWKPGGMGGQEKSCCQKRSKTQSNRFLGTRMERKNQLAGASYNRHPLLGLSSSGIQLMPLALALGKLFLRPWNVLELLQV